MKVQLSERAYDIRIQPGVLSQAADYLAPLIRNRQCFVVTDHVVGSLHAATLTQSLRSANIDTTVIELPAGEVHKTLAGIEIIYAGMLGKRVERSSTVIALGGGVIGDMAGFAAATVLRGVPFVQCPTTLLAMVDASVGGKTGVNHAAGKNLIGAFHQPIAVLIDPLTLRTLPKNLLSDGLAECIKHEMIRDAAGFGALESNIAHALDYDVDYLSTLIAHNVAVKARVVENDPTEHGERVHLNLGHTFGHALEKVSGFRVPHGSGVAIGIMAASHVAVSIGLLTDAEQARITRLLVSAGLPTRCPDDLAVDDLIDAMKSDKKVEGGHIRLVLPDGIGKATIRSDIPIGTIRQALTAIRQ